METLLFTPSSIIDLLSQIDELKDLDIGISQTFDDRLQLQVGSSIYEISTEGATDITVDDSVVETIDDVNSDNYEELNSEGQLDVNFSENYSIESGFLKEIAKNLLLGGMIRLSGKLLKE